MSSQSASTTQKPISAALARRLAEAADGYRNIGEVNFLARYEPDKVKLFDLSRAYPAKHTNPGDLDPEDRMKLNHPDYDWFGPYDTKDSVVPKLTITRIVVWVMGEGEEERPIEIPTRPSPDPEKKPFDALFWSLSAVEKFAVPYYARLHGGKYADQVVTDFIADDFFLTGHRPGTEYGNPASPFLWGLRVGPGATGFILEELSHGR